MTPKKCASPPFNIYLVNLRKSLNRRARKFLIEKVAIPREEKRNQPLFTGKRRVNALGREATKVERKREKKEESHSIDRFRVPNRSPYSD